MAFCFSFMVQTKTVDGPLRRGQLSYVTMAGPRIRTIRECARDWITHEHQRRLILPIPFPGKLGQALRRGTLTCSFPDIVGQSRFVS